MSRTQPGVTGPATPPTEPAMSPLRRHRLLDAIWRTPPGLGRLGAVNHSIVGARFMMTAFVFFAIGGILAMLIRAQLARPGHVFMPPEQYNQVFTMHGTVMMFLFAIPMFEGLAMYLLPKMLGARDLAFPRLSAYGYWCYLLGGGFIIGAMLAGVAPDGGWFMYTPLSSSTHTPGINADVWLLGITFVEISAIGAAVEITASILKMRGAGMALRRMPILAWYFLVTAVMMLVGFPPLILGSILLEVERAFGLPFFDPARGGDPLLWQHLFWLFGHPEVYIIFLPAAGVISTVLPVFARHRLVGYNAIVLALVAMGFLSFGLWVHHMFAVGIPHIAQGFFSAASMAVAIPTAVQIFAWLATLLKGRPRLDLPMLYLLGFFFIFVNGGLTGVMVAVVPFDWQVHDSYFVVAHLHYVLVGGFVFPLMAGAYYWMPLVTGRMPIYHLGRAAFWLIFVGFNLTFLLMHLTGLLGMPRRVYTYPAGIGWDWLNLLSSVGGFMTAIGFALFAVDMLMQRRFGRHAPRNPWGAESLEWSLPLPPPSYNAASLPPVDSREPLAAHPGLGRALAAGQHYLATPRHGWMETLGVEVVSGRPDQIILLPRPTLLPLWTALATGLCFLAMLLKQYWLVGAGAALVLALALFWLWSMGMREDPAPLPIGHGESALPHPGVASQPGWWGMALLLVADGALFGSLLFGALFLWVVAPGWPPPALLGFSPWLALLALAGLLGAPLAGALGLAALRRGRMGACAALFLLGAPAGLLGAGAVAALPLRHGAPPTSHAYAAAMLVLALYVALHAALGAVMAAYTAARCGSGHVSALRDLAPRNTLMWQGYTALCGLAALLLLQFWPWMAAP
ncbi:cytochrome c oxidase subunit I [Pseudoroseomonas rhizosphaerae]|uniref:cytochrome-c oxidase n=1 Tax=Teichococcus rhizosphaerae TaxID=1335062 RepID=A0A2C7A2G1_9PROT|nr:cytochrome c oxidase subunit I [Pseudoroseomonas rhizosphaerae]PHK94258.1 cytochrome c oxidase subunit I [Pseudoroseomonas rhizosphaerae]